MARSLMRSQKPGHTLQPTALVHEAYLRLMQGETKFDNRAHFFGAAARAMRQVLVGHARKRNALKRAGAAQRVTFSDLAVKTDEPDIDLLALDQALTALAARDSRLCRVLELRYFAGLALEEIAELCGQSLSTVKRDWSYARAWIIDFMNVRPVEAQT
jgi:RNA polymerase sigma-70 factor, ECF subfamily